MEVRFTYRLTALVAVLALLCLMLSGCAAATEEPVPAENTAVPADGTEGSQVPDEESSDTVRVYLDEELWQGDPESAVGQSDYMVYIALGGELLIALPFEENHVVTVLQPDGSENTVMMTGTKVLMMDSNCDNHDCILMGEVTKENLEERVLGGFIICLPHQISVEVRGK